ncbi:hypothetical protein [Microbacterium awajiense]|uniref:hypothetical protein n=1 Tax=Microbacterium awajiense TaxID=415214 RepID=UPI0031D12FEC
MEASEGGRSAGRDVPGEARNPPPYSAAQPVPREGDAAQSHDGGHSAEPGPTANRRRRRVGQAALGVIGVAVAGALATAIITPERLDWALGLLATPDPSASPVQETAQSVQFKRVTTSDSALAFDVPEDWLVVAARWNYEIDGVLDEGSAGIAGHSPADWVDWGEDGVWLGASVDAATRLGLPGAGHETSAAWVREQVRLNDYWLDQGCVLSSMHPAPPDGVVGEVVVWENCAGTAGVRLWELWSVLDAGEAIVLAQLTMTSETSDEAAARIISSIVIAPDRIASAAVSSEGETP